MRLCIKPRKAGETKLLSVNIPLPLSREGNGQLILLPALYRFLTVLLTPLIQSLVIATAGFYYLTGVRVLVGFQRTLGAGASCSLSLGTSNRRINRRQNLQNVLR